MRLAPSPVKRAALDLGLEHIQPDKARDPALLERLSALSPDVCVVVAYGSLLPKTLLDVPPKGFVNLHFSLLPLYRGAAPLQRSIMNGDDVSGASIMVLTEGMDEGPVIAQRELPIHQDDTTATYGERLSHEGALLLLENLGPYADGALEPVPQDPTHATYAPKLTTEDARIDWSRPARNIRDQVRALDPDPGAWTVLDGTRLKVLRASEVDRSDLAPGRLDVEDRLLVGTGSVALSLDEVQPATKKRMSGADLLRGAHLTADTRIGGDE
jgi:methionyl-tRNA formyltransferase